MSSLTKVAEVITQSIGTDLRRNAEIVAAFHKKFSEQVSIINQLNHTIVFPEIYRQIQPIDFSAFRQAVNTAATISALVKPLKFQIDASELTRQIEALTANLNEVVKRITVDFAAIGLAFQNFASSGLLNHLQEAIQASKDEVAAFCAAGWPIAPSMPRELRDRVVKLHKQGKTRYISQAVMGHYRRDDCANLIMMVDSWREHPLLKPRFHIIADSLEAHRNRKYTLSIPTLMPQIEGVLNDYVKENGLVAKFGKIQEVYTAAIGNADGYVLAEWAIAQTLLHLLRTSTYAYTNFEDELKKSIRKRTTTRHTVLHGIAVHYNQPINSLKAFLLIDAISVLD